MEWICRDELVRGYANGSFDPRPSGPLFIISSRNKACHVPAAIYGGQGACVPRCCSFAPSERGVTGMSGRLSSREV